jgi:large subunit ribosomal protein L33
MAKKKGDSRVIIELACSQCLRRTYTTTKNKKNDPQRLELNKYCPSCRGYTVHKETK